MTQPDNKTEKLEVRLTPEEKNILRDAATRMNMTQSDFIRLIVLGVSREIAKGSTYLEVAESFAGTTGEVATRLVQLKPFRFEVVNKEGEKNPGYFEVKMSQDEDEDEG